MPLGSPTCGGFQKYRICLLDQWPSVSVLDYEQNLHHSDTNTNGTSEGSVKASRDCFS